MNNQTQTPKTILQEVKELRLSASRILKIKFVNKLVELIQKYKADNKSLNTRLEQNEKMAEVAKYEFTKNLDEQHPMFETLKEKAEKNLEYKIKEIEKDNQTTQKQIDENTKKIKEWENKIKTVEDGTLKFSRQHINEEVKEVLNCL